VKTFRYPKGHLRGSTMTVAELREKLNQYPPDMPVIAQWEGTWNMIEYDAFDVEHENYCHPDDMCDCLVIDVDRHY
jgi:hypothetical protein